MKETKLLTKRKNKTYLQILNDEKKYYKKKIQMEKNNIEFIIFNSIYYPCNIYILFVYQEKKIIK
jgi:hypothetical protein